jgi:hypothetical protein
MNAVAPIAEPTAAIKAPIDDPTTKTTRDPLGHLDPKTREACSQSAVDWRRERDRQHPPKRDPEAERKSRIRDFAYESLEPARNDLDAVLLSLTNDDDVGADHHFRRLIAAVKHAAPGLKELSK